eukprot:COSAG03_NODE_675_length_6358_cov_51.683016_2_plen_254_part_00
MTPWGSRGDFQNASILPFVSPSFCFQSLSFVILRSSPFASPPSLAAYSLLVPHSFSIPSLVRNLGMFSNPIPLLAIFDRRFLATPFDPRLETRCNRRARPKEKFRLHSQLLALTPLRSLLSCSSIPLILQVSLHISHALGGSGTYDGTTVEAGKRRMFDYRLFSMELRRLLAALSVVYKGMGGRPTVTWRHAEYDSGASLSMRAKQSARRRSKTYILLLLTNLLRDHSARQRRPLPSLPDLHGVRAARRERER